MKQPEKLTRKAIRKCFPLVSEATWDYLFDVEEKNGLMQCRVAAPNAEEVINGHGITAYYDTEKLKEWLCMKGYYAPDDFLPIASSANNVWGGLIVRQHRLTG